MMVKRILLVVVALLVAVPVGLYAWTRIAPHQIRTEIEIDASPERVWRVLTDFGAYPQWNPFIVSAVGEARVGAVLTNRLSDQGSITTFTPTVLAATPGRELRWIGRFGVPGIVDGEHYFRIEDLGGGRSRLTQGETFTGALVPLAGGALDVADNFAAMNTALKARAEKMPG
ncbi:SRPBCC family protein [Streptosporangium canum]|uniref:SRPBCC family protein n=1 Tax=Streptosporangium canum TaxID=324952 RepID=UPI0037A26755